MVINARHREHDDERPAPCGVTVGDLPEEDLNRVYYYAIFPNMLLSLHPDYVMFHTLWPEAHGPHPDLLLLALPSGHPERSRRSIRTTGSSSGT